MSWLFHQDNHTSQRFADFSLTNQFADGT